MGNFQLKKSPSTKIERMNHHKNLSMKKPEIDKQHTKRKLVRWVDEGFKGWGDGVKKIRNLKSTRERGVAVTSLFLFC